MIESKGMKTLCIAAAIVLTVDGRKTKAKWEERDGVMEGGGN